MMNSSSNGKAISIVLWILAFLLMLGAGVYQRLTGPTHPMRVSIEVAGESVTYRLVRAAWTDEQARIELPAVPGVEGGVVSWRRYPTRELWSEQPLARDGENWIAMLPIQPAAGKLEYSIAVMSGFRKPSGETRSSGIAIRCPWGC